MISDRAALLDIEHRLVSAAAEVDCFNVSEALALVRDALVAQPAEPCPECGDAPDIPNCGTCGWDGTQPAEPLPTMTELIAGYYDTPRELTVLPNDKPPATDDLVRRLRDMWPESLGGEAADLIERQAREIAALRECVRAADAMHNSMGDDDNEGYSATIISVREYDAARAKVGK